MASAIVFCVVQVAQAQELMDKEILGYSYVTVNGARLKVTITTRSGDRTGGICAAKSFLGYSTYVAANPGVVEYFCYNFLAGDVHAVDSSGTRYVFPGNKFVVNTMHQEKRKK